MGLAFQEAWRLIVECDAKLLSAIVVTLGCSVTATGLAVLLGAPIGILLGRKSFVGRRVLLVIAHTGMALPTVVIGLFCYSLLSRRGVLGSLGLLYTQQAIVFGELLLALPIVVSLFSSATEQLDRRLEMTARTLGASRWRVFLTVLREARPALVATAMATFGRVVSELGIALMVGGNIELDTQTLTGMIAFETTKGKFSLGMASGLVLLVVALAVNIAAHVLRLPERRRQSHVR